MVFGITTATTTTTTTTTLDISKYSLAKPSKRDKREREELLAKKQSNTKKRQRFPHPLILHSS